MKTYLRTAAMLLVLLLAACQSDSQLFEPNQAFVQGCESAGGNYQTLTNYGGGFSEVCQFADGLTCGLQEFNEGACPPAVPASVPVLEQSPTPFPTKNQAAPATPEVKGADPFPGWATYLNPRYDFAFRYPDTWLVEEGSNQARLTRPGLELLVRFQSADAGQSLPGDLPYQGEEIAGLGGVFFGAAVPETLHRVDDRILAATFGTPEQPLVGRGNVYTIQLVSLQSDTPLPDAVLAELRRMLSSFEVWTNNDQ
jgi:hypothetical protein